MDNFLQAWVTKAIRTLSLAPDTSGTQSRKLGQMPNPHQSAPAYRRSLHQLIDHIIEVGGEIEGVDGDVLVWHGPDRREEFEAPELLESEEGDGEGEGEEIESNI